MKKIIEKTVCALMSAALLCSPLCISSLADSGYSISEAEETYTEQELMRWRDNSFDYSGRLFNDDSAQFITEEPEYEDVQLGGKSKGDVDLDGKITSTDALNALKASIGLIDYDIDKQYLCDVSEDGYVTSDDALQILKKSIGLIDNYDIVDGSSYRVTDPYKAYTSDKLSKEINAVAVRYHDAISLSTIGETANGKPLYLMKLGKGSRKVLYVAEMHGSEHITTAFLMRMAERYAYCYLTQRRFSGNSGSKDVYKILNDYTIYMVPMVNPEGADKTILEGLIWKANGQGVDINDNFPTSLWSKLDNGVTKPGRKDYKGKTAGSENETKALIKLCDSNKFEFMLSFHTKGQVIYWKDSLSGDVPGAKELTQKVVNSTGYTAMATSTDTNSIAGGFENWFREAYNRPGLCIETTPSNGTTTPHNNADFDTLVWNKASCVGLDVLI